MSMLYVPATRSLVCADFKRSRKHWTLTILSKDMCISVKRVTWNYSETSWVIYLLVGGSPYKEILTIDTFFICNDLYQEIIICMNMPSLSKKRFRVPQLESNLLPSRILEPMFWKVIGSTPVKDLRTLLHSFQFIQVSISLNIYSHLSFRHIEPCRYGRPCVTRKNLVYDLVRHEPSIVQRPIGISGRSWVRLLLGNSEIYFPSNSTWGRFSIRSTLFKSPFDISDYNLF